MPISEAELRGVFDKIDSDGSGTVDASELHVAMKVLGIRVSLNSAAKVLKVVDRNRDGTVDWPEFKAFFSKVGDADGIKKMLSNANQRFFEYREKVLNDASFAKTFVIPPFGPPPRVIESRHNDQIEEVRWLSDTVLVSGSLDGELKVWDTSQAGPGVKPTQSIKLASALYSMAVSADGNLILVGHDTGKVVSVNAADGTTSVTFEGHDSPVFGCCVSPVLDTCASGSKFGTVCHHDLRSEKPIVRWPGHKAIVYSLEYDTAGDVLCSASGDGTVKLFDVRQVGGEAGRGEVLVIEDAAASEKVFRARWRNEHEIVTCGDDFCLKRWDIRNVEEGPVSCFFGHTAPVRAMDLSGDGRFLVSGTTTGSCRLWLADQTAVASEQHEAARSRHESLSGRRQELIDLCQAGEPYDQDELKDTNAELEELGHELTRLKKLRRDVEHMECTQASLALESPTQAVSSVAWRDLGNGHACIAYGAYDQKIRLVTLEPDKFYVPPDVRNL